MARRKTLAKWLQEAREKSKKETGPMWVIRLSFPVTDVFCEKTLHPDLREPGPAGVKEDIGFTAALMAQGIEFETIDTDRHDMVLIRSKLPWEVLCLREEFMANAMKALRQSGIHGSYYKSGTLLKYEF